MTKKNPTAEWLSNVPSDKVFWAHNGPVISSLDELAAALQNMPEETYAHHVSPTNNDFSNWIRDVIGDSTLANNLARAANREAAIKALQSRLKQHRAGNAKG